jgi:hypothetical protein
MHVHFILSGLVDFPTIFPPIDQITMSYSKLQDASPRKLSLEDGASDSLPLYEEFQHSEGQTDVLPDAKATPMGHVDRWCTPRSSYVDKRHWTGAPQLPAGDVLRNLRQRRWLDRLPRSTLGYLPREEERIWVPTRHL